MLPSFQHNEVIQVLVNLFKKQLEIDNDIVIITDRDQWTDIFPKDDQHITNKPCKTTVGLARKEDSYIFINIEEINHLKDLTATLLHELFHLKYPKATEQQIEKLEKKYVK